MSLMKKIKFYVKKSEYVLHETKRNVLVRFLLIVAIFVSYFALVSIRYGIQNGLMVTILTWSFFVFCTPIADAGFLVDFPVRILTKIRMLYSEIVVWIIAFLLNSYSLFFNPNVYEKTPLLMLFRYILLHPFPFWAIIIVSATGTFMSVYFGDELIDVVKYKHTKKYKKHKNKYKLILLLFIGAVALFFLYTYLLEKLGMEIPS